MSIIDVRTDVFTYLRATCPAQVSQYRDASGRATAGFRRSSSRARAYAELFCRLGLSFDSRW